MPASFSASLRLSSACCASSSRMRFSSFLLSRASFCWTIAFTSSSV